MRRRRGPSDGAIADTRRLLAAAGVTDASNEHVRSHALWRERSKRRQASVDRLTARVVWGHYAAGLLATAWHTLAIAGPRGALP